MDIKEKLKIVNNVPRLPQKIYFRTKKSTTQGTKFLPEVPGPVKVYIEGHGQFTLMCNEDMSISVLGKNGEDAEDRGAIFKIKHTDQYRNLEKRAESHIAYSLNREIAYFEDFYTESNPTLCRAECDLLLSDIENQEYEGARFDQPYPTEESVVETLRQIARREISTPKFWEKGSLVEQYVAENLQDAVRNRIAVWNTERQGFEEAERKRFSKWKQSITEQKSGLKRLLERDEAQTTGEIYDWVDKVELPFDFGLGIEYNGGAIVCSVKAPDLKIIPKKCGKAKTDRSVVKSRDKEEINGTYYSFILGLVFFVATNVLGIAVGFDTAIVNAYDGDRENDCIFSARFTREEMAQLTGNETIGSIIAQFRTWSDVKEDKSFKHIKPIKN